MESRRSIHLLLIGAGRAHLEILRRLAHRPIPEVQTTVISPSPRKLYSRMVPGYLCGKYSEEEATVDVGRLASRCGARLITGRAVLVRDHEVVLEGLKSVVPYDFLSFALGSNTTGDPKTSGSRPAVTADRMAIVRDRLLELVWKEAECTVVVAGGGAAGVEIAFAIARVLDQAGRSRRVTILDPSTLLLDHPEAFRRQAQKILKERQIEVRSNVRCLAAGPGLVTVNGGRESFPSDLSVWLTEPVEWTLFTGSRLHSRDSCLQVYPSLQSVSHSNVFAAPECAEIQLDQETEGAVRIARDTGEPLPFKLPFSAPKTGSYADGEVVRLWRSLRTVLMGRELPQYPPARRGARSFLDTADGLALCSLRGKTLHSRSALQQKEWLDRRWVARYQL